MLDQGTILQGRYTIQSALGKGGMGAVYLADDNRTQTKCVIKELMVVTASADRQIQAQRQFKQEAPGGRVEVSFAVGEDGKARRVRTDLNTTGSEPFARCIEGLIGGWSFPRPVGGEFELTYPFVFSSGS